MGAHRSRHKLTAIYRPSIIQLPKVMIVNFSHLIKIKIVCKSMFICNSFCVILSRLWNTYRRLSLIVIERQSLQNDASRRRRKNLVKKLMQRYCWLTNHVSLKANKYKIIFKWLDFDLLIDAYFQNLNKIFCSIYESMS